MVNSTLVATLYVNPTVGNDTDAGSRVAPTRSITRALKTITTPTIIQLAAGTYSDKNGEIFPLVIPTGVMVLGNEATKGQGILIAGSGEHQSPSFGVQNITLILLDDAQLMGVTVTNFAVKGTGVWIESTAPTLANNTFTNCGREGVFVSGTAKPAILDNLFVQNSQGGLVMARNSKGEVLRNVLQKNALGMAISDFAAPLIANNKLSENRTAIALSRDACPVLRNNIIEKNTQGGLLVNGNAAPDLGSPQDPAGNIFRDNGEFDLQNASSVKLLSAGNQLNPARVKGLFELIAANYDSPQSSSISTSFPDMTGHWAAAFVEVLFNRKLMSGLPDGSFAPVAPITRAQYAAAIAKAFQLQNTNQVRNFTDVKPDFWAASAIRSAAGMGFISGFPDGTFRPAQNLTKIQALVSLVNGLRLSGGNPNVLLMYGDRAQIPSYATNAIATATQKLLVVNYPQTQQLEPLRDITRAEVAALIYQALVAIGKEKAIASPYIVQPDPDIPGFTDLVGHWAEAFIPALASMNLTKGFLDGSYQPDKLMTRAQYAAIVAMAFNPTPKRPAPDFTDIPKDFWAYKAIQIAASSGFVGGFNDRTFRPNQNVQRLQVIVSLVNGLGLTGGSLDTLVRYSDQDSIPDYARTAIATATQQKIVVNYPDIKQLSPTSPATRGEVAAMVYQALVAIGRISGINSPYIVSL
ncbi:MAG: S-layer homology domain-containing protein [Cyanomargarita calcarea GSE-NOS-MK-12-04C]|jgi:parallel beta-helix repeat protein|uniref:S-layer homology domain-containing protein n=1 Tax=Cyanomargarita calcarea GSE-NOS-MK-12-04C TaxID=2839659 RepID=A0A951USR1_9CYAN|nr:S-layer homology domain-containing protein [Cyanomargarita calcarea GSE-NOS-MK-12-04C]